ncbi:MAG: NHL repeat-containing protein, partial [Planctomycetota bacterium]
MMRTKQRKGHLTVVARMLCSFLLLALLPVTAFAVEYTPLATIKKGLTYPTDIAVSGSGSIYVVDGLAKKVMVYNGGYLLTGSISSLENPTAVAVSGTNLLIADNKTKSVKKVSSSGAVVGELKNGGTTATFKLPRNIAVDGSGKVYVVDQFGNSIEVFDAAGNYT